MKELLEWSKGNPGALTFLMDLMDPKNLPYSMSIIPKLTESKTIRGTNLYVLWSDLCNRDIQRVAFLCERCPSDILEDACSRQDYSGRKLVEPYLA